MSRYAVKVRRHGEAVWTIELQASSLDDARGWYGARAEQFHVPGDELQLVDVWAGDVISTVIVADRGARERLDLEPAR